MQFILLPHPGALSSDPELKVWVNVDHAASLGAVASTNIWFCVGAPIDWFVIPEAEDPGRADELWQTTCFEAFLRPAGQDRYQEWNFAPSGEWAAYDFTKYREGREKPDVAPPYVRLEDNFTWWALGATIAVEAEKQWELGLSAVLEEKEGAKSYWALAHPSGDKPDFHAADCFAAKLA